MFYNVLNLSFSFKCEWSTICFKLAFFLVCHSHQVVKAFVILSPRFSGDKESLVKELQDHVKETTAPYKYPRKVFQ